MSSSRRKWTGLWLAAVTASLAFAVWRSDRWGDLGARVSASDAACKACNVVLVVVDTLRADHLASYGYSRVTSPALDRFARENVQFLHARSQSACTFPSMNSLLTSRNPFVFLDPDTRPGIPQRYLSVAEVLERSGYSTAAVSASPIVKATPGRHNPVGGFGKGFQRFDESSTWGDAAEITQLAVESLNTLSEPFFLYLHYMDPHDPLEPAPEKVGLFSDPYQGSFDAVREGDLHPITELVEQGRASELTQSDIQHLVDLYDESIATFDSGFNRLLRELQARGLKQRTIVVVAADHGESFLEHGAVKHCNNVFDHETRVPLLFQIPNTEGRAIENAVQNLDVVPTLLDLVGIEEPAEMEGDSLRSLIASGATSSNSAFRYAFSTMGPFRGINDNRYKLIENLEAGSFELFDLLEDPGESKDQLIAKRDVFRRLSEELRDWSQRVETNLGDSERAQIGKAIRDELHAIGYL